MAKDRSHGFVVANEEFEHGVVEVAVPVRDPGGGIVASLSVLGGQPDVGPRAEDLADVLAEAAARLGSVHPGPEG
jgi:DNA-binding IclR family transcriptional regulator